MKAVVYDRYGGPALERLRQQGRVAHAPGPGDHLQRREQNGQGGNQEDKTRQAHGPVNRLGIGCAQLKLRSALAVPPALGHADDP